MVVRLNLDGLATLNNLSQLVLPPQRLVNIKHCLLVRVDTFPAVELFALVMLRQCCFCIEFDSVESLNGELNHLLHMLRNLLGICQRVIDLGLLCNL